jgi:hypothetical protein
MTRSQKISLLGAALLAVSFLFWWRLSSRNSTPSASSGESKITDSSNAGRSPAKSATATQTSPSATHSSVSVETQQRKFIDAFNSPITFFGQVVDQNGVAVVAADVRFAANDSAFGGKPSQYMAKSDNEGRFSISGIKGISLAVEVSKAGYRIVPAADNRVTSSGVFNYGLSSTRAKHQPDPGNPVRFVLHKLVPSEALYKVPSKDYPIAQDGSPLVISLDPAGIHQVMLRCWSNGEQGQQQYDWRAEVAPINGGLLAKEDLSFEAPTSGYTAKDSIDMSASLSRQQWDSSVEKSYFLRFEDGFFGTAKVQIHSRGDHFVTWESSLNATRGSTNLEPGQ